MGWRDDLVPASFRGVPFEVEGHTFSGGRRLAVHEFPLRDSVNTEDLGRRARRYRIKAFIMGPDENAEYFDQRDALVHACQSDKTPGILSHPWLGTNISVRCETITLAETIGEGGMASFDLAFVDAGVQAVPAVQIDTSGQIIASVGNMQQVLANTLAILSEIAAAPGIVLGLAESIVGGVVSDVLGCVAGIVGTVTAVLQPLGAAAEAVASAVGNAVSAANAVEAAFSSGVTSVTSAISGITGDPVAVAVLDMFTQAANAVLAIQTAPPDVQDAIGGQLYTFQRVLADPTLGLAQLAAYGTGSAAPTGLRVVLQTKIQADALQLIQGAATLAVAQIYASTDFTSSDAAQNARTQLLGLINAQVMSAANAMNDPLYHGWLALAGQASQDLLARVLQLPALTTYSVPAVTPACVLAQRLYQDGTRAEDLALLNDIPHPGFLPAAGIALAS